MDLLFFETPFGRMGVAAEGASAVTGIFFPGSAVPEAPGRETVLLNKAKHQLLEYFSGVRTSFDLPLHPKGTVFQKKVWNILLGIPYGETRYYREVAEAVGNPCASKAIGGACRRNPVPILIPCHRVVGVGGRLTGFGGGLELKAKLLNLEQRKEAMSCKSCFNPEGGI